MDDIRIKELKGRLRRCMGQFLGKKAIRNLPCLDELQQIGQFDSHSFLCGGAVRDILLSNNGSQITPRDLDIILGYGKVKKVAESLKIYEQRWNCYGGVSIKIKNWNLDLWELSSTWAFKEKNIKAKGFADFPSTTFLDVDAVAVQLFKRENFKREIYSKGFFEAVLSKTMEINLEENPNPAACIVRTLRIANKFGFAIGPKLARYIASHADQIGIEELLKLYKKRYKIYHLSAGELSSCIKEIKRKTIWFSKKPISLPLLGNEQRCQLLLWENRPIKNTPHFSYSK